MLTTYMGFPRDSGELANSSSSTSRWDPESGPMVKDKGVGGRSEGAGAAVGSGEPALWHCLFMWLSSLVPPCS